MDLKITAEWLHSFGDDDYEPSGLMTPRDRAELERRQAERRLVSETTTKAVENAPELETIVAAKP